MDTDKNGKVSKQEFMSLWKQNSTGWTPSMTGS